MWNNIITEKSDFVIENHSATLKGEFSRIDFNKVDNLDNSNAIVLLESQLPVDLSNLSITDQVGNITTARAKYKKNSIGK